MKIGIKITDEERISIEEVRVLLALYTDKKILNDFSEAMFNEMQKNHNSQ